MNTEQAGKIEKEAEKEYPYPDRDFCLNRKDYETSCALVDLKRIVFVAGRTKTIEEKDQRIKEYRGVLQECHEYLAHETYEKGKPIHLNYIGSFSKLHQKIIELLNNKH